MDVTSARREETEAARATDGGEEETHIHGAGTNDPTPDEFAAVDPLPFIGNEGNEGPYADGAAHLGDHLFRVSLAVERLRWAHGEGGVKAERFAVGMGALDAQMARRLSVSKERAVFPLERLQARFGLSERALHVLVAAASPGLVMARGSDESRQPEVSWLVELLACEPAERDAVLDELLPGAPLRKWRLVRLGPARGWMPEGPLLLQTVSVPQRIASFMKGRTGYDPEAFDASVRLRVEAPEIATTLGQTMARALFRTQGGRALPLLVVGTALSGKAAVVLSASLAAGRPVLEADLEGLALMAQPADVLADLAREARLHDAVLLLRHGELLAEAKPELRRAVMALLIEGSTTVAVTTREELPELLRRVPGLGAVRVELPSHEEQLLLWHQALPPEVPRAPDVRIEAIVTRYRLTPGDILEAGAQAVARAQLSGSARPVSLDDVVAAVRGRLRHRLGDIAELVLTPLSWSDLVLREDVLERIGEMLSTVKNQSTVMTDWGFERKVAYGRAVSSLFAGPPGTGKTMVATLIAKELGLELFRVDLSRVVSKWVGETEKNLGRAFDEASRSQAVLLFDEADALFAKRTEVKSSNDRYANLEVNYLLQRLESFEGIVILTTNHQTAVDDAFRRRLRFRIDFPTPDESEREKLWRAMLPPGAPLAPDVDFKLLARKYSMAGGYIKNAVVRAAFLAAASTGRTMDNKTFLRAASLEWEDMGNLAMG